VLRTKGCTIAVLGSGLGRIYPQDNVELARSIAREGGALVSEFPMMFPPDKRGFPMRNRLISGMTLGTIVVEAGTQSGALITATQALDQGRQVFAVPGRIDSPQSRGCHALIRDGARLVESFADVLDEFAALPGVVRQRSAPTAAAAVHPSSPAPERPPLLSDVERKVVELVQERGEVPIDDLIADAGEPANRVLSALVSLEIRHIVSQLPGKRVVLRTAQG
jgi:DNA processing protein